MKAIEARKKYFEDYVEFEFLVRRLGTKKIQGFSSRNKSLSDVIAAIGASSIINKKDDGFNITTLLLHKNTRNWLAHQPKNATFSGKFFNASQIIKGLNKLIIISIKK